MTERDVIVVQREHTSIAIRGARRALVILRQAQRAFVFLRGATGPDYSSTSVLFSQSDVVLGRFSAGAGRGEEIACTAFGRSVIASASAAAARVVLGLVIGVNVAAPATTLAGYAIGDAYTKAQVDTLLAGYEPLDPDLAAIAALGTTGYLKRTGSNVWALSAGVPWSDLTGTPTTLAGYGVTDAYTKTASDARFAPIAVPWASITGTPTTLAGYGISDAQPLDSDLTAIAALSAGGIAVQTAVGTWAQRTITGTANRLAVTNGSGVGGNPTLDIDAAYVGQASITTLGTIATGVWNAGAVTSSGTVQSGAQLRINTDAIIERDAANILAHRNGTSAQTLRVYNTYTDASNYERLGIAWASNALTINVEIAGTGVQRDLALQTAGGSVGVGIAPVAKLHVATPIAGTGAGAASTYPTGTWAAIVDQRNNSGGLNGLLVAMRWQAAVATIADFGYIDANSGAYFSALKITGDQIASFAKAISVAGVTTPNTFIAGFSAIASNNSNPTYITNSYDASINPGVVIGSIRASDGVLLSVRKGITYTSGLPTNTGTEVFNISPATAGFTIPFGYLTGSGGTVTQATSKSTGVALSKANGQITMNAAALAAGTIVSFVVTNTLLAATDLIYMQHQSGGTPGSYSLNARAAAGSFTVDVRNNTAGSLSEALVISFAVIKGVTA